FLATAVAQLLSRPLLALALSIGAPPGHRYLAIGFDGGDLMALLVAAVLMLFGHLVAAAAAIEAENRAFV
ncbi:MAG: DUF2975 domain-containing protein, partial [Rhizobiaceae bacterium]